MSFGSLCDTPLDLYRTSKGQDQSGATTRTTPSTPLVSKIACAVQPLRSFEQFDYSRRQIEADCRIYSVYNFDANVSGGIKLGDLLKDPARGFTYVVKAVEYDFNSNIDPEPLYKIICKRLIV